MEGIQPVVEKTQPIGLNNMILNLAQDLNQNSQKKEEIDNFDVDQKMDSGKGSANDPFSWPQVEERKTFMIDTTEKASAQKQPDPN